MENTIKAGFNLSKILSLVKAKIKENKIEVELHLNSDSSLVIRNGGLSSYFTQESLQKVLNDNNFESYYKNEAEDLISEMISKHIINELYKSMGKAFPEIK